MTAIPPVPTNHAGLCSECGQSALFADYLCLACRSQVDGKSKEEVFNLAVEAKIDEFADFCLKLTLDSGVPMVLEPFQRELVRPYFAGVVETGLTIPKANAKTCLLSCLVIHHLLNHPEPKALMAAAARDQSRLMFDMIEGFIERSLDSNGKQWLKDHLKVQPGYLKVVKLNGRGEVKCVAADPRTVDGQGNTLVCYDEYEHARTADLYGKLRDGLPKRSGQLISIATAGEEDSPWGRLRSRAMKLPNAKREGCKITASNEEGTFAYVEYSLSDEDAEKFDDFVLVKQCNPLAIHTPESLKLRYHSPSMEPWQWAKDCCGLVFGSEHSAFDSIAFRKAGGGVGLEPGEPCSVGADLAARWDTSAFVPFVYDKEAEGQYETDGSAQPTEIVGIPRIISAPKDGSSTPFSKQLEALLQINAANPVQRLVLDMNAGGSYLVEMMNDRDRWPVSLRNKYPGVDLRGIEVVPYSQDPSRMADASMALAEAIRAGRMVHPDHEGLTAHVLASRVTKTSGERWRIVKGSGGSGMKIDAAVALAIVRYVVMTKPKKPKLRPEDYVLIAA